MKSDIFDVAIIGAGVTGAAIARKLSSYKLDVVLLEKEIDVSFGVSKANSGIIHAGFHHPLNSLKAKLEVKGNLMYDSLEKELNFPFKRTGILVVAFNYEEMKTVEHLYRQGVENNVIGIELCNQERIHELEPKLNADVIGGLYAPTGGIIEPYRFVFALVESAIKNKVVFKKEFKVVKQTFRDDYYDIFSEKGENIKARYVINAAGLYADEVSKIFNAEDFKIKPRKGEEFLLARDSKGFTSKVIFPVPTPISKGILVIPTVEGTLMIGPTAEEIEDKSDFSTTKENFEKVFYQARRLVPTISEKDIITSFAGLRPALKDGDFFIKISDKARNFVQVAGIQSPGLTAAPAIAEYVKDLLKKDGLKLIEDPEYDPFVEHAPRVRDLSPFELDELVKKDPLYGNIICRCETVSEAEIVEAIRKGHTTLDGIKFYTRAGMGKCQGGFCTYKILKILERETGVDPLKITKKGKNSYLIKEKL